MKPMKDIHVNINIAGSVVDSEVIGVKIARDGREKSIRSRLFSQVFFEYLLLPSFQEVAAQLDRRISGKRGRRLFDFDKHGLEYLWMSILGDHYWMASPWTFTVYGSGRWSWRNQHGHHVRKIGAAPPALHPGTWVTLRNVQLTPFVNRSPGKFYRGGWEFSRGHDKSDNDLFLVSTSMWTWEDYAVRTLGIGDVRFRDVDDFVLLECVAREHSEPGIMETSGEDGSRFAGGACLSALGFPILITQLAYRKLRHYINELGGVFVSELHAKLLPLEDDPFLFWAPGIPKMCLVAADRAAFCGVRRPGRSFSALWTVATNETDSGFHYCTWGFEIGTKRFRHSLEAAARLVKHAITERGLRALFEFDATTNWFGEGAAFGPLEMEELHKRLKHTPEVRAHAALVAYSAQFDNFVARALHIPLDLRDLMCRGLAYLQTLNAEAALACFKTVEQLSSVHPFITFNCGRAAWLSGDVEAAIQYWRDALKQDPDWQLREQIQRILEEVSKKNESNS